MRPMTAHKIDVGLDKDGKIVGWKHRVVGGSAIGYTNPGRLKKSGGKDVLVMAGSEVPNYGIPNWMAVDPGIALPPHNIVAQMESNIIYGLSQSIKEQVMLENGAVQQSNFHDYEVFRMADVPNVEVKVMPQGGYTPCDRRDGIATDGGRGRQCRARP